MVDRIEFEVVTIFPGVIRAFVEAGLLGKAQARGLVAVHCSDPREFTSDRHRTVDDAPFGGGAGMVLCAEPVIAALEQAATLRGPMHRILLTPSGTRFDQRVAERLARLPRIALLCGRYEGIDDRVREGWVDECLSIGDFVLNGGEVAAATIIEAVARLREGVLGNPESIATESFAANEPVGAWDPGLVVEHPHYTRPAQLDARFAHAGDGSTLGVPELLLRGDHGEVERWRRRIACLRTHVMRPELRPAWRLPSEHRLVLVAPRERAELVAEAEAHARALGLACTSLVLGTRGMRDLKQAIRGVRKQLRRSSDDQGDASAGDAPAVVGIAGTRPDQPTRPVALVLDVLAFERRQLPRATILWLGSAEEAGDRVDAWLALDAEDDVSPAAISRLAIPGRLIDISQPLTTEPPSPSRVRRALEEFRDATPSDFPP